MRVKLKTCKPLLGLQGSVFQAHLLIEQQVFIHKLDQLKKHNKLENQDGGLYRN